MRLPLLKAEPQKGDATALATEAKRIQTLAAHCIAAFFNQAIVQSMQQRDKEVIELLRATIFKLQWITKLPFQKALGHDLRKT